MTNLTRRTMLLGAATMAATTGTTVTSIPALAAAPPAGKQAPSYYRHKLGDYELTQVSDGTVSLPLSDAYVKNVPKAEVSAALEAAYMSPEKSTSVYNPIVVNTGSKLILIDTGLGPNPAVNRGTAGQLMANMAAAGIDPKEIDVVIISHLHPDHVNGLRTVDGGLAFPNAEIKVPAKDWSFWMDDNEMSRAPEGIVKVTFQNARRVFNGLESKIGQYDWNKEVAPGIIAFDTAGHTPGHTSFTIQSGSAKLLVQSDVTNHPALFVRNPDWHIWFDMDGAKAAETRHKFYDMAAAEKALIAGFHFPFPALGHVEKDGARYRLVPIAWSPAI
jgi:glyoxylase-like metal-dependent hydrolase (beta-lactamase superfamily II)